MSDPMLEEALQGLRVDDNAPVFGTTEWLRAMDREVFSPHNRGNWKSALFMGCWPGLAILTTLGSFVVASFRAAKRMMKRVFIVTVASSSEYYMPFHADGF